MVISTAELKITESWSYNPTLKKYSVLPVQKWGKKIAKKTLSTILRPAVAKLLCWGWWNFSDTGDKEIWLAVGKVTPGLSPHTPIVTLDKVLDSKSSFWRSSGGFLFYFSEVVLCRGSFFVGLAFPCHPGGYTTCLQTHLDDIHSIWVFWLPPCFCTVVVLEYVTNLFPKVQLSQND